MQIVVVNSVTPLVTGTVIIWSLILIYDELKWIDVDDPLSDEELIEIEKYFSVTFPEEFKDFIRKYHCAVPKVSDFDFYLKPFNESTTSGIGIILGNDPVRGSIIKTHKGLGESAKPHCIPFIDNGGGDYVCLDFAENPNKPKIVYFYHELLEYFPIADSFLDWCEMLYEPEDGIDEDFEW